MGKVFTFEEVKGKRVPLMTGQNEVVGQTKRILRACPAVIAGVGFGSYAIGKHNRRSDLDFLVVYDEALTTVMVEASSEIHRFAKGHYVDVEIVSIDRTVASTGAHHICPFFLKHLHRATSLGCIKQSPCGLFGPTTNLEDNLRTYIGRKCYDFDRVIISKVCLSEDELFRAYKKALEVAYHVGRKAIELHDQVPAGDDKAWVVERYPQVTKGVAVDLFLELVDLDQRYTNVLDEHLAVDSLQGMNGYGRILNEIEEAIPAALAFVRQNALDLFGK